MAGRKISKNEAAKMLRTVAPDKAFYFYKEIGEPLGSASNSLNQFADLVKDINPSSVKFHIERGDFGAWFRMLGDRALASKVNFMRGKNISPEELRARLSSTVTLRVSELYKIAGSK
jgi:hypothetical protein